MVGIVIISHGKLATNIMSTIKLFTKDVENVKTLDLTQDLGPEEFMQNLKTAVDEVNTGQGVLVMADLFGGTPANSAWKIISSSQDICCITGVNLGMVLEVLFQRKENKKLSKLLKLAKEAGTNSIKVLEPIESN
ncbi:PTS sugar transporter subunit IIA [Anaerosalibacter massiliensis]|uniref:PTS sugar transporter subunit IIA n=1 Tax=Anaerosalibacter massiliensis TaxID=1347392 RepID=A0A9X2S813_9FIRM|nr:PTS sugar transporter subunit IIA [Anaerosalibacter massiliensis]MCR2045347.1 PTS sugar transporter subunit IIA [Anaerosalibacter massiliensis]